MAIAFRASAHPNHLAITMDVRCSRCGTDYEFDDTLISERGTTVKCTNCSYQFKIFPPKSAVSTPERWLVRTAAGTELVFTSLRELQRGISEKRVGPNDLLSRGRHAARPLGSIPELEPFFVNAKSAQDASSRGLSAPGRTLHGVAPPPSGAPRPEQDDRPTSRGIGRYGTTRPGTPLAKVETTTVKIEAPGMSSTLPISNPVPSSGYSQRAAEPMILGGVAPTVPGPARPPPKPRSEPPRNAASAPEQPQRATTGMPGKTLPLGTNAPKSFDTTMPAAPPPVIPDTNPPPEAHKIPAPTPPAAVLPAVTQP
ncbi:MAG TPA: zinc-ribbon domain-containing protein, partial [Polyangiaceae bacterium]|nr:zinc-ribbon domain-containing protein [Polyangiaceae bacterium]